MEIRSLEEDGVDGVYGVLGRVPLEEVISFVRMAKTITVWEVQWLSSGCLTLERLKRLSSGKSNNDCLTLERPRMHGFGCFCGPT